MGLSGRLVQAAQASRAWGLPISINAWATSPTSWMSTQRATAAMERGGAGGGERGGDASDVLAVHPAAHVGHGAAGAGGREQQDRQELGAQELPVVGVLGPVAADVGGVGEQADERKGARLKS